MVIALDIKETLKNFSKLVKEGHDLSSDFIFLLANLLQTFTKNF